MLAPDEAGTARARSRQGEAFAAIDLGTNNCRLLIARRAGNGFAVLDAFSRVVRLGEGLGRHGVLSEAAIERTVEALAVCAAKIARWGVGGQRHIATEACRRAANCDAFVAAVARRTGLALEIIPPAEEVRLSLAGCLPLIDRRRQLALLVDIGGGSTEISLSRIEPLPNGRSAAHIVDLVSLPFGVVTLSEAQAGNWLDGRLPHTCYRTMVDAVRAALLPFEARHGLARLIARDAVQLIGTSGTVTTVAAIHLGLRRYSRAVVDGARIPREAVHAVSAGLAARPLAELAAQGCIGPERADLVLSGCAILEAVCGLWPVARIDVADRGLREGILLDLMGRQAPLPLH